MSDTEQRIRKLLVEHLGVTDDEIKPETPLIGAFDVPGSLGADSLDQVELVLAFEEEFGISIPNGEEKRFINLAEMVRRIDAARAQ